MPSAPKWYRPPASGAKVVTYDDRRGTQRERGYTRAWEKARKAFLAEHPLCHVCEAEGRYVSAIVVDHHIPHRRDMELFWDVSNWRPMCVRHHNAKSARERLPLYQGGSECGARTTVEPPPLKQRISQLGIDARGSK